MPAVRAERLCPHAIFVPPDFVRYKAVSRLVRDVFARHTDLIEPLSLDEAYLDVTVTKTELPSETATAEAIRAAIREETQLTASAGVAPNKFLAKIASDWRKPDGLFVIRPHQVEAFLTPLPIGRLPGVGKVMEAKLETLGIHTVGELRELTLQELEQRFGRWGRRLHELSLGIDEHAVQPDRPTLQVSAEDTFEHDLTLGELEPHIRRLAEKAWAGHERELGRVARTVVLKLKTSDFHTLTRSFTPTMRPSSANELANIACALRDRVERPADSRYRLVGVGLSGFTDADSYAAQRDLFDPD
jgi:DNA polymerase-4